MYEWKAVRCCVCGLPVRKDYNGVLYEGLQVAIPGPHSPCLNEETLSAFEIGQAVDIFSKACAGSEIPGPVITGYSSEMEEPIDDEFISEEGQVYEGSDD